MTPLDDSMAPVPRDLTAFCGPPSVFQEFGMCTERVCLLSLCCVSFIVMMVSLHLGSGPLSLTCCVCLLAMMK